MTDSNDSRPAMVIERTLDCPIALAWQMWTDPEHFKAWYGPMGASIPVAEMDVRVGGKRFVAMAMETPNGPMKMFFTGEYTDVSEPQRLAYTESMADENGNTMSPADMGMPEGHPETTEVIVELEDVGGKIKMVLTHAGVAPDSPGAGGWGMALDKLSAHIESLVG